MATILVTGGLGYIGAHMALLLKQRLHRVIVLDNNGYGRPNLLEGVEVIYGDIRDKTLLDNLFSQYTIDAVMHFAGYIQVGESVTLPQKYYDNNVVGTLCLLDAMVTHKVQYCIFSSTAALYGQPHYSPINEAHPIQPLNPYGTSKWMIEQVLKDYRAAYGLRYGVLRYFNAAGCDPEGRVGELHEPETHLLPLILQVAAGRRPYINIYGNDYPTPDGSCIRDYVHVIDLCIAHMQLLDYLQHGGNIPVFNLGTGKGYSVLQVIEAVKQVTGKDIPVVMGKRREGDAAVLVADGSLAAQILGWKPVLSGLETLIAHAWQWEKQLEAHAAQSNSIGVTTSG